MRCPCELGDLEKTRQCSKFDLALMSGDESIGRAEQHIALTEMEHLRLLEARAVTSCLPNNYSLIDTRMSASRLSFVTITH